MNCCKYCGIELTLQEESLYGDTCEQHYHENVLEEFDIDTLEPDEFGDLQELDFN